MLGSGLVSSSEGKSALERFNESGILLISTLLVIIILVEYLSSCAAVCKLRYKCRFARFHSRPRLR